jgi:adenylate cyclase
MPLEIERKFLVLGDDWRALAHGSHSIRQGYLAHGDVSIRVRIINGASAVLTLKARADGISRKEFEYDVPLADAGEMLVLATGSLVEKTRHLVPDGSLTWEIDEFAGQNAGLVIAEVELHSASQELQLPAWLGREVSDDGRYYNAALSERPYTTW